MKLTMVNADAENLIETREQIGQFKELWLLPVAFPAKINFPFMSH
jgi:hypothetical protein